MICRKAVVFLFRNIIDGIQSTRNSFVLVSVILIAIFEFFVDIPAFKKAGMIKDAKVTTVLNIVLLISSLALFIIIKI